MTAPRRLPFDCEPIDELLEGGIETGTITQVYGPPAAGKTNLALAASVAAIARGERVLYLDTEGISPARLDQFLAGHPDVDDPDCAADRLVVRDVHDFDEQREAVKDATTLAADLSLVILDSATGYYRLERDDDVEAGASLRDLVRQVTHLLSVARRHDLAVLLTNQVFTDPDADRARPLGGHSLAHWSGVVLRIDRFRGGNRRVTLEQHRSLPAGGTAAFRITDRGIEAGPDLV